MKSGHIYREQTSGFILAEILIGCSICLLIFMIVMEWLSYSAIISTRLSDDMDLMADGRYTRIFITNRLRYGRESIEVGKNSLDIGPSHAWVMKHRGSVLYRRMSNGEHQPLSGKSVNQSLVGTYVHPVGDIPVFRREGDCIGLSWIVDTRSLQNSVKAWNGTGRQTGYRVQMSIVPDYEWYPYMLSINE